MYEYGNWEQGRAVWFLGIHISNLLCSVPWARRWWAALSCRADSTFQQGRRYGSSIIVQITPAGLLSPVKLGRTPCSVGPTLHDHAVSSVFAYSQQKLCRKHFYNFVRFSYIRKCSSSFKILRLSLECMMVRFKEKKELEWGMTAPWLLPQSTYRGRRKIGGMYLPSQLEVYCTPQLCSWW